MSKERARLEENIIDPVWRQEWGDCQIAKLVRGESCDHRGVGELRGYVLCMAHIGIVMDLVERGA